MKRKAFAVTLCCAVAVSGLTACGDDEKEKNNETTVESTEQNQENKEESGTLDFEEGYEDENWDQ